MKLFYRPEVVTEKDDQDSVLCSLWDTINTSDVAQFYLENDIMDVLGLILSRSQNARLTELTAGIVANLVYNGPDNIESFEKCIEIKDLVLKNDDSLALYQLFRILRGCSYKFTSFTDFYEKMEDEDFEKKICFILENSMHRQLLNEVVLFCHDIKVHYENG